MDSEACRVVLDAVWDGTFDDRPESVSHLSAPAEWQEVETQCATAKAQLVATAAAGWTDKVSTQQIWTYGYPGQWDELTRLYHGSYNGSKAQGFWAERGCCETDWTLLLGWKWAEDSCKDASHRWGPATTVFDSDKGSWHCSPTWHPTRSYGGGYYHAIYSKLGGTANGSSTCTFWVTGTIVAGPARTIIEGCT